MASYFRSLSRHLFFWPALFLGLFFLLPSGPAGAEEDDPDSLLEMQAETVMLLSEGPTLLIHFENDIFYDEDRYYTNAVQFRLISRDLDTLAANGILPEGISGLLEKVPFPGTGSATRYDLSFAFGPQIYTPQDTDTKELQKDDRPYAG